MKRNQSYFEPTEYGKEIERKVQILDAARFAIDNRQTMGQFTRMADGLFLLLNDRHNDNPGTSGIQQGVPPDQERIMKNLWSLYWSPEGRKIAVNISAPTARAAIRKAPQPYKKYLGEIYAVAQTGEIVY